jgi:hypothetical protein
MQNSSPRDRVDTAPAPQRAQDVYHALLSDNAERDVGAQFLRSQLSASAQMPIDLPDDFTQLDAWSRAHVAAVGEQYRAYLAMRKAGGARRYFPTRSHALHFIRAVAPTKLVDGAWLYGVLDQWENTASRGLIRTYLEELGDGVPGQNHVVLYQKLLAANECDNLGGLPDDYYVQGAIQLALAHGAEDFLPEIIGYNLGYEQLPLHLLICGYELNELGIDPYYFTLHVTIDNADNGHAQKAIAAIAQLAPALQGSEEFARRVRAGYRLNEVGANTLSVMADFDLEAELLQLLAAKGQVGQNMHSDYCRVGGRAINDWLSDPESMPRFLAEMEKAGWISRGEPVANSRFWQLLQGPRAEMFGVFNAYELQVLQDWIEMPGTGKAGLRIVPHRAQMRMLDRLGMDEPRAQTAVRGLIRHHAAANDSGEGNESRQLEERIGAMTSKAAAMAELRLWMAPHRHHTPLGLMATRMYARLLDA